MKPDLKKRIKEFNKIKFNGALDKRIITTTLKSDTNSVTIAS
tara:strand:- start:1360 stop:1485 length:126 start_codon:yes stop_codon:yes gene_type:complete